jgi:hypothetical protein
MNEQLAASNATTLDSMIEMVPPPKLENGERRSDSVRAHDGLIASLNRHCEPAFVKRLAIVVPRSDQAAAAHLAEACRVRTEIIVEDEFVVSNLPRSGLIDSTTNKESAQPCLHDAPVSAHPERLTASARALVPVRVGCLFAAARRVL